MIRRPPRSTRTYTLFPYTTLFRSLTTHYLEEAESLCRNLAIIDRGTIVAQEPMRTLLARLDVEGFLRSEEHTSELQSLMRSSYAVFCLKKKKHRATRQYKNRSANVRNTDNKHIQE